MFVQHTLLGKLDESVVTLQNHEKEGENILERNSPSIKFRRIARTGCSNLF
jgi:hypothetical protein